MDFFVDFRDFAKTAKNSIMKPLLNREVLERDVKRDKNGMKMAGFTVFAKKKMVIFKS